VCTETGTLEPLPSPCRKCFNRRGGKHLRLV